MAAVSVILNLLIVVVQVGGDDESNGGWKSASLEDSMNYYSNVCTVPRISVRDMTKERFEKDFQRKPFILTFPNGAEDWVKTDYWTVENLTYEYQDWRFTAGKSIDIVYNGGRGDVNKTFEDYIHEMRNKKVTGGDLT